MGKLREILSHPQEIIPLARMYRKAHLVTKLPSDPDLAFCYGMLNDVSRSFAIVIQELPNPLRDAICVFYLVLRGLDTVEDDMALDRTFKLKHLRAFHENIYVKDFKLNKCGTKHYARLMQQFPRVLAVFSRLEPSFQEVIADITQRMGHGMAEFIDMQDVVTVAQYNQYCHYVAGLVGIGLSNLFAYSGLESESYSELSELSNHMGLFLQKTNIIRDYLEDIMELPAPRMFWPRDIWSLYAPKGALADFKETGHRQPALRCINHMVLDALTHLPHCIDYMRGLTHPLVFRFCAIPQIMAAGTLALCYNNGRVFEGVVKMRRGQTALIFSSCDDMGALLAWFNQFLAVLADKASSQVSGDDPTLPQLRALLASHQARCSRELTEWWAAHPPAASSPAAWLRDYTGLALAATHVYAAWGMGSATKDTVPATLQPVMDALRAPQHAWWQRPLSLLLLWLALYVVICTRR